MKIQLIFPLCCLLLTGCGEVKTDVPAPEVITEKALPAPGTTADQALATGEVEWLQDLEAVKAKAGQQGKVILADFSGSDWCHWCMKLDEEVFSKPEFKQFAGQNLVLFLVDFPNRKQLPPETAAQNRKLADKYGVQGYPTVLLLDAGGNLLATTGYKEGGAAAYVEHLKGLLKK
ncbi:MAG: thioredoxin family protein [Candidatus Wallbacteria bacterium]|nr:thioredoxin family protein [Candidatus Wallbacteria bacterium]